MKLLKRATRMRWFRFLALIVCACVAAGVAQRAHSQSTTDAALNAVRASDRAERESKEKASQPITAAEHMRRAGIYMANRAFAPAREHWQAVLDDYPNDANVTAAIYGIARSYYQERRYEEARQMYERVAPAFPDTKEGREGSNFAASSILRMGRGAEAAERYVEYIN